MNAIWKLPVMVFAMATINVLMAADIGETLKDIDDTGAMDVSVLLENVTLWYSGPKTNAREVVTFETNATNFRFRNFTWAKDLEPPYVCQRPCFLFRKLCKTSVTVEGKTTELPTGGELTLDGLHYDAIDVNRIDAPDFRNDAFGIIRA